MDDHHLLECKVLIDQMVSVVGINQENTSYILYRTVITDHYLIFHSCMLLNHGTPAYMRRSSDHSVMKH